jgi:hypothetical protein
MAKTGLFEGQSPGTLPWSVGNLKYRRMGEAGSLNTHISGVRIFASGIFGKSKGISNSNVLNGSD